ncbi:MAG: hypothetical protein JWR18_3342 [Segetibacter sp.]|jgi:hypothetical protein|nr:hypothetical protein [Segetibacter sp.]
MEPLFEAKALFEDQYALYNVHRLGQDKYKAQLVVSEDNDDETTPPKELVLIKKGGKWQTEDSKFAELGSTIGIDIDVFNNGYGALLGRIGNP